jgi:hypothetical protein
LKAFRTLRLAVLAVATTVIAPAGLIGFDAAPALAVTNFPAPYVTTANGSDPDAEQCTSNGQNGYCLFTSQDLNQGLDNHGNYYPMNQTQGYFSTDGTNWTPKGAVLDERSYVDKGWTPAGADHLWAPQWAHDSSPNASNYLYLTDCRELTAETTSSYIGVSRAPQAQPFGPYIPDVQLHGDPSVHGGYASDPNLFKDSTGHLYLDYANGDASNCGGISIAPMSNYVTMGASQQITLVNDPAAGSPQLGELGGCDAGDTHNALPYMEGPSIYYTPSWHDRSFTGRLPGPYLMVFAAKPSDSAAVPSECAASGQPDTTNEVIAYATSRSPTGSYTYGGILMCGSAQEWTNQASILPVRAAHGDRALALVYHDASAPGGPPQGRTLHAECLSWAGGASGTTFAVTTRTTGTDAAQSGVSTCLHDASRHFVLLSAHANGRSNRTVITALVTAVIALVVVAAVGLGRRRRAQR